MRDASGLHRRSDRTRTVPMLHLDHRRPITFAVWSVRVVCTVGGARLGCTGRLQGGGYQGSPWRPLQVAVAGRKMGSWRDKVRFVAVAEKTAMRASSWKQNIPCARTQLRDCKEVAFLRTSNLCPQTCPGDDSFTRVFLLTQESPKTRGIRYPEFCGLSPAPWRALNSDILRDSMVWVLRRVRAETRM